MRAALVRPPLGVDDAADQQRLAGRGHPSGDALAEPEARAARRALARGVHRAELILAVHQHDGAVATAEQLVRAVQDRLQHLLEVEDQVHRLGRLEQRADLSQAIGECRGQDALLDQELSQPAKLELLLDRVGAEEQDDYDETPLGNPRDPGRRPHIVPKREGGKRHHEREQQGNRQDPELVATKLDGLEGGRLEAAQARDAGRTLGQGPLGVFPEGLTPACAPLRVPRPWGAGGVHADASHVGHAGLMVFEPRICYYAQEAACIPRGWPGRRPARVGSLPQQVACELPDAAVVRGGEWWHVRL